MQDPAPLQDPAQPPAEPSREDGGQESARPETAEFRTMSTSGTPASGTGGEGEPERPDAADDARDDTDAREPADAAGDDTTGDTGGEAGPEADTEADREADTVADDASGEETGDDVADGAEEDQPAFSALVFNSAGQWTVPAPKDDTPAAETPASEPSATVEQEAADEGTPAAETTPAPEEEVPRRPVPEASVPKAAESRPGDEPEEPRPQEEPEPPAPTPQDEAPEDGGTHEGPGAARPGAAEPGDAGPEAATPVDRPHRSAAPTVPEIDRRVAPRVAPETVPEIDVAAARPKRPLPPPPTVDDLDPLGIGVLPRPGRDEPGAARRGPVPPHPEPEQEPAPKADLTPRAEPAPAPRPEPAPAPQPESAPERAPERAPEPEPEPEQPAWEPEPAPEPEATPPSAFYEEAAPRREAPQQRPSVPGPATTDAQPDVWAGWPQSSYAAPAAPPQQQPPQQQPPQQQPPQRPPLQHRPPHEHQPLAPPQQQPFQQHPPLGHPPQERLPQEHAPQEHAPQEHRPQEHLPQGYAPPPPHQERQHTFGTVQDYGASSQYGPPLEEDHQEERPAFGEARDFAAAYEAATSEAEGRKKKRRRILISLVLVLVLLGGGAAGQLLRPVPEPRMRLTLPTTGYTFPGSAPVLPLPTQGQAALYVEGIGPMGASGATTPTPTASVAKVMTAYVFLRGHPLAPGQDGPTYTVSPQAVAQMPARRQRGESLLGITLGMRLTERKALEALMIISANDVAHELARWDSGDPRVFVQKMNDTARALGMTSTRYTDPSGYDSGTVSTAADQVKLLRAAMAIPAFVEIVSKRYYVPHDGGPPRPGGNILIGQYGVFGGKTGYTDAAGGNFVFAARRRVGGADVLFLGAVMGQRSPSAVGAIRVSRDLLAAAQRTLTTATLAQAGAQVGRVDDGLGGFTPVRAAAPVTVVGWPGLTVRLQVEGDPPRTAAEGTRVGTVKAGATKVPLELGQRLEEPSLLKRLIRLG